MNIKNLNSSRLQIILVFFLILGLALAVYLVQVQQIFKSKASVDVNQAFEIKDDQGNLISCSGTTCYTNSQTVNIKLKNSSILESN